MSSISAESIRSFYSSTARRYEMILKIYRALGVDLNKWRVDAFERLPQIKNPRILDVAVGTGANLPFLIEKYPDYREIVGIDYTHEMLARARKRIADEHWENTTVHLVDAKEMTKQIRGEFDLIVSTYALSIIPESPRVLREIQKVLSPSGYLMLLDCQKFTGLLKIFNPLAILLSTRLGGNNETYSVPVSNLAAKLFQPISKRLMYSGMFYEDIYQGIVQ